MPESRADDTIKGTGSRSGIRYDPDGQPALFLRSLAGCFHHAIESAADQLFRDCWQSGSRQSGPSRILPPKDQPDRLLRSVP